jgi:hypothetical protein
MTASTPDPLATIARNHGCRDIRGIVPTGACEVSPSLRDDDDTRHQSPGAASETTYAGATGFDERPGARSGFHGQKGCRDERGGPVLNEEIDRLGGVMVWRYRPWRRPERAV